MDVRVMRGSHPDDDVGALTIDDTRLLHLVTSVEVIESGLPPTDGNRKEDVGTGAPVTRNQFIGPGDRDATLVVKPDGTDAFKVGRRVIATRNPDLLDFDRLDIALRLEVMDETFLEAGHSRQYFL